MQIRISVLLQSVLDSPNPLKKGGTGLKVCTKHPIIARSIKTDLTDNNL
jgi:hypothetical protein